jgi:hypothetical protein
MDLHATDAQDGVAVLIGETFDGRPVRIEQSHHLATVCLEGDVTLVPHDFRWVPLDGTRALALVSDPAASAKIAAAKGGALHLVLRADRGGTFSVDGPPVEKLAHTERHFLSIDEAMFLLGGLGVPLEEGVKKLGAALALSRPVTLQAGRSLVPAADTVGEACARAAAKLAALPLGCPGEPLLKEAAVIPDPVAVDTVLSLGFLNGENLALFLESLPTIEDAQERMCELLLAARLGLRDVPPAALEKAIRATEQVLDGLRVLAFERPDEAA